MSSGFFSQVFSILGTPHRKFNRLLLDLRGDFHGAEEGARFARGKIEDGPLASFDETRAGGNQWQRERHTLVEADFSTRLGLPRVRASRADYFAGAASGFSFARRSSAAWNVFSVLQNVKRSCVRPSAGLR